MLENPACSLLAKVVDEGVLHSVDSREFRRLIAPRVRIIWKQSAVLRGGSVADAGPRRVQCRRTYVISKCRLLNLSPTRATVLVVEDSVECKITFAPAGTGSLSGGSCRQWQRGVAAHPERMCSQSRAARYANAGNGWAWKPCECCDNFTLGRRSSCAPVWTIPTRSGRRSHSGAQSYLVKPVQHLYLSAAIERCLVPGSRRERSSRGGSAGPRPRLQLVLPAQLTRAPAALIARCERYSPGIAGVGLRPAPKSGEIARRFQTPECW